jgi:hypothetical protein
LITVSGLKLIEAGKAEVEGGIVKGRLWGYGGAFIIEKADGRWKLLKEVGHWEA